MTSTAARRALFGPAEVSRLAGGELAVEGRRDIRGVVIDSRQAVADCLFVALEGSRVDGHRFIPEALEKGAAAVMASRRQWSRLEAEALPLLEQRNAGLILVEETLVGLQELARRYLQRFPDLLRVGVTGSNGKTTTKEILGSILSLEGPTVISEGNLNSEIGLPLSCFQVRDDHCFAAFEMGINHPGEMEVLADIFRPDYAVVTNIGSAHIGLLGSQEGIAREKKNIFRHFHGTQKAFLYEDEEFYSYLIEGLPGTIVPFGPKSTKGFKGSEDLGLDGTVIHWEGLRIRFPLFGVHNARNALASISVSVEMGISKSKIKEGLERVRPLFGRSEIVRSRLTVIQDCYNANPDSIRQVFAFVAALAWKGRKIAVLGSMKELGGSSSQAHHQVGLEAVAAGFQALFLFGEEMEEAFAAARAGGFAGKLTWSTDFETLGREILAFVRQGDLVVIKGSRAVELERLMPLLNEV